ncbi:hypothetical protein ACFOZY_05710 [Chungangia koreensis]|uniref:Uncharacterized protein n=1 Tax=Chungangia koreensis TaxID=752657 RepID=A0ABV8X3I2_9LACT
MDIAEIIDKINHSIDEVDFVTARKLIENNFELISKKRQLLNRNARELFEILKNNLNAGIKTLSRSEMTTIYAINSYATNFDINGLKLSVKNNLDLLMRQDITHYLNQDAKAILTGMKMISGEN